MEISEIEAQNYLQKQTMTHASEIFISKLISVHTLSLGEPALVTSVTAVGDADTADDERLMDVDGDSDDDDGEWAGAGVRPDAGNKPFVTVVNKIYFQYIHCVTRLKK